MKLCVIGNSHAGMLGAAIRDYRPAGLSLSFFAKPKFDSDEIRFSGTVVSARSRALKRSLGKLGFADHQDLSEFDGVVLVGMSASVFAVSSLLTRHWVYGWPSTQSLLSDGIKTSGPLRRPLLSEAAILAALCHMTQGGAAYKILKALRKTNPIPVCIVPQPFPAERVLAPGAKFPVLQRIQRNKDGPSLIRVLERSHETAFGPFERVALLKQQPQTVVSGWLTSNAFSHNSVRYDGISRQDENDVLHANSAYGDLVLQAAVSAISKMAEPNN